MATCSTDGCSRAVRNNKRQLCQRCFSYWYYRERDTPPCNVDDCTERSYCRGFCGPHYKRLLKYGDPGKGPGRGSPGVKRGIRRMEGAYITRQGYRRIRLPNNQWVAEHRHLVEQAVGRALRPGESVHHKNGIKTDNRPENLELWVKHQPTGQRVEDLVSWAHEIISRYAHLFPSGDDPDSPVSTK